MDYAADVRRARNPQLDRMILLRLTDLLADVNLFIPIYKTARERLATQLQNSRLLLNPQLELVMESGADRRRENLPTGDEITVILLDKTDQATQCDILLAVCDPVCNSPSLTRIDVTHAAYMPLHYVLFFPYGDLGYHYGLELRGAHRSNKRLHQRDYYKFRLHVCNSEYPTIFYGERLFQ